VTVRILVADDNPHMRAAIRLILEQSGNWEVIEAASGEEVLDLAREQTFQLIILDLAMPGVDGISAARILTEKYPSLPILMHTLYWSQRVALEALKAGVRKVIPKSDKETILNAVREVLESQPAATPQLPSIAELPPVETTTTAAPGSAAENRETPSDSEASGGTAPKA
jgi:DNA-binding NarL/FixJ family response regulator